jgi:hypothetical protein
MRIPFPTSSFAPDRRSFLAQAAFCVAGVAGGSVLPASLLQASSACIAVDACGDWQLDDICNAYPPYAFRRDAEHPRSAAAPHGLVDPLDALFVTR